MKRYAVLILCFCLIGQLAEFKSYHGQQDPKHLLVKRQANGEDNGIAPNPIDSSNNNNNNDKNNRPPIVIATSQPPPMNPMNGVLHDRPWYPALMPQGGPFVPPFGGGAGAHHHPLPPPIFQQPHHPNHHAAGNNYPQGFDPFGPHQPAGIGGVDGSQGSPGGGRQGQPGGSVSSAKFINDLGSRLMSMFGIGKNDTTNNSVSLTSGDPIERENNQQNRLSQDQLQALNNATVLQQLNRGMHSVFSNLSKMWNSTVQQQLDLLQERMRQESANGSNVFQQRIAQQVPMFFKTMVARVSDAQENLNRFWKRVANSNGTATNITQLESLLVSAGRQSPPVAPQGDIFSPIQDLGGFGGGQHPGAGPNQFNFIDTIQRTFGFGNGAPPLPLGDGGPAAPIGVGEGPNDNNSGFKASLVEFWHQQIQPQMARLQGKISRVWQDLTNNGLVQSANQQQPTFGGFQGPPGHNVGGEGQASPASIESLLNSIDVNNPEYTLIEDESGSMSKSGKSSQMGNNNDVQQVGNKIQNSVINMQRDLNQMWHGVTNSLQVVLGNVKNLLNPPQQRPPQAPGSPFGLVGAGSQNDVQFVARQQQQQPQQNNAEQSGPVNEIDGKIKDLSRLQNDANTVYKVIQDQQQQQQQRVSFTDRFKHFFNNINVADHVPQGFQDSFSQFGHSVNDFWNQIPNRWDRFIHTNNNNNPNNQANPTSNNIPKNNYNGQASSQSPPNVSSTSVTPDQSTPTSPPSSSSSTDSINTDNNNEETTTSPGDN